MSQQCTLAAMKSGNIWIHINRTTVRSKEEIMPVFLGLLIKEKLQTGAYSVKNHQDGWETGAFAEAFVHPEEEWKANTDLLRRLARKHSQAFH